ncbi:MULTISPECIES: hypothetical protein [Xanthomonas translucens group]|nr:hypothetical protein [Xanthomonas translucens]UKE48744.1 hypothetical protein KHA79_09330 [Xanthomonas translucens pv. cerealis]UKE68012.1 hypothetical protein K8O61_10735 [Xanthomonas translucens pv. pistacia]
MIGVFAGHEHESKRQQMGEPLAVLSGHHSAMHCHRLEDARLLRLGSSS